MIDQHTQDILFDYVVVCGYTKASRFVVGSCGCHLLGPWRGSKFNRTLVPSIGFLAADAAGQFLAGHLGQVLCFEHELFRGSSIRGYDTAQRSDVSDMTHECASIDIPNHWNFVAVQIKLSGFRGAPVGGHL